LSIPWPNGTSSAVTAGETSSRGRVELGGRHDPHPCGEHAVRDEHDLRGVPGDVRRAPDEGVLPHHDGLVFLYAVLGADVDDDPLGELVANRRHDARERPVLVGDPPPVEEPAQALVLPLQTRGLRGQGLSVAQPGPQPLLFAVVEGVPDPAGSLPDGREQGADAAAHRLEDL
jgi:hypothetical protein